jgi:hypothetical protein
VAASTNPPGFPAMITATLILAGLVLLVVTDDGAGAES